MRKLLAYFIIAVATIALGTAIVLKVGPTSANAQDSGPAETSSGGPSPLQVEGQADEDEDASTHPFVGIVIETLASAEALELEIAGGAVVRRVLEDGPSAGLLIPGDIITAIGGTEVTSARDVIESVGAAAPGDTLSFAVLRNGVAQDVDVTVGERPVKIERYHEPAADLYHGLLKHVWGWQDKLARFELTLETDDGFQTFTAVVGRASDIDVENGTFVLTPKDGSDPIFYEISTSTKVVVGHTGDLGGLNTEEMTLVVEMDGVKLVLQGDLPFGRLGDKSYHFGHQSGPRLRGKVQPFTFRGPYGRPDFWEFRVPPELRERLEGFVPGTPFEGFGGGEFRVPPELQERLREFLPSIPFERFEGEAPHVFRFPPEVRELKDPLTQDL